jgi:hypothetical protein
VRLHGGRYNSARWSFFPFLFYVFSYFLIIWLCWSWHLNEHIPIDSSNCLFINMGRTVTFSKSNSMISFLELLKKYLAKSLGKIKNMVGTWWRNNLHWQFRATLAVKHPLNCQHQPESPPTTLVNAPSNENRPNKSCLVKMPDSEVDVLFKCK